MIRHLFDGFVRPLNLYDFEALARSRMDPGAYDDFADGVADELTLGDTVVLFSGSSFPPPRNGRRERRGCIHSPARPTAQLFGDAGAHGAEPAWASDVEFAAARRTVQNGHSLATSSSRSTTRPGCFSIQRCARSHGILLSLTELSWVLTVRRHPISATPALRTLNGAVAMPVSAPTTTIASSPHADAAEAETSARTAVSTTPLFANIADELLRTVAEAGHAVFVEAGGVVFRQGGTGARCMRSLRHGSTVPGAGRWQRN